MKVAKDLVVSLAYQVRTEDGVLVDESPVSAPLDYLHGHGSLISGLETALEGHEVGDKFDVAVGANDAYGQYDENLLQLLTAKQRSKMTIRNQLMHWVLRWVVTWKTLLKNKKNWASNWIKIS